MVSTRQMCGAGAAFDETPTSSTRATVVRRIAHYQTQPQSQQQVAVPGAPSVNLVDLPTEVIHKILSHFDYKKISSLRLVCHRMNDICMNMLNTAFSSQIKTTYNRFQSIKSSMPRRESARRNHPLACECDIIETCYMRLSLLHMSMGKHIERGHCCFFPGAILDEVISIFAYISRTPRLERPFRVTDELFDLSTMAMEYFRDRIEPTLPGLANFNKVYFPLPVISKRPAALPNIMDLSDNVDNSPPQNHMVLRKGIRKIKQGMKIYNNQLSVLRTELRNCKRKAAEQSKQLAQQQNLLEDHQKQALEYATRLDENDKKNEEMARKFSTLLQELNKCKTELQFWRSKSPAVSPVCNSCNQKVTPVLPPEDLQALVNQGVDPDNILLNETGTESEAIETHAQMDKQFVFPDESTTVKLLAVNTAVKNIKRRHAATCDADTAAKSNAIASNETPSNFKGLSTAVVQQTIITPTTSSNSSNGLAGYSTKLFYGNHQRSGVIVSPVSMNLAASTAMQINVEDIGEEVLPSEGDLVLEAMVVDQVETKKTRRVQKANKCVNAQGKRSKY